MFKNFAKVPILCRILVCGFWLFFEDTCFSRSFHRKINSSSESLYYRLRDSNSILSGIHLAHSNYCSSTFIQNFPLSFLSIYVTVVWSFSHIQDLIFHPFLKFCISHVHLHKSSKPLASQILNLLNSRRLSIFFPLILSPGHTLDTVITRNFSIFNV